MFWCFGGVDLVEYAEVWACFAEVRACFAEVWACLLEKLASPALYAPLALRCAPHTPLHHHCAH
jgi:hypothetical protein